MRKSASLWDKEDPRIAKAFEGKELYGYSVKEIAKMLKVSEPSVYQLIARAKAIGKEYRKKQRITEKAATGLHILLPLIFPLNIHTI